MVIPRMPKEMIMQLITQHGYTMKAISQNAKISQKTLYKILKNKTISKETQFTLTLLYVREKIQDKNMKEENFYDMVEDVYYQTCMRNIPLFNQRRNKEIQNAV